MSTYSLLHIREINSLRAKLESLENAYKKASSDVEAYISGSELLFHSDDQPAPECEESEYLLPIKSMKLKYASDGIMFFALKGADMSPEDSYAFKASGCERYEEFFDNEKIEEFIIRRRVTVSFKRKEIRSSTLDMGDSIFFEKVICPGCDRYQEDNDFIYTTDDESPSNPVRVGGRITNFDPVLDPEIPNHGKMIRLFYDGRIAYIIELTRIPSAVCDIIRVTRFDDMEKRAYFTKRYLLQDASQIVVVNSIVYYLKNGILYNADSSSFVFDGVMSDVMVSDGRSLYYKDGRYIRRITITY